MKSIRRIFNFRGLLLCASLAFMQYVAAAPLTLATGPLANSTTATVLPNIMFVLDDSGSMDWDYMPDTASNFSGKYGYNSHQCNGVYYNPNITYTPPINSTGGPLNATATSFSAAYRDGFKTSDGTVNLSTGFTGGSGTGSSGISLTPGPAFYYVYSGTQNTEALKKYSDTNSVFYKECNSTIGTTTAHDGTHPVNTLFTKVRLALVPTTTLIVGGSGGAATITFTASTSSKISSVVVSGAGGGQILSATTSGSSNPSTIASRVAANINACTTSAIGNCAVAGYSATASGNVVTISGPASSGATLTVAKPSGTGNATWSTTNFPTVGSTTVNSITVNGSELLSSSATGGTPSVLASSLQSKITLNGYSATVNGNIVTVTGPTSASTYTPVITFAGGATLTISTEAFPESTPSKLQNFANWYSYYSTRMLMMKTAAGQAFQPLDNRYRVGFITMNNNVSPGIVEVAPFNATQKSAWYSKLYAANPGNNTPLREILSRVGQYYAHKFGTVTTYSSTITVGGSGATYVDGITVGGTETMNGGTAETTSTSTLAKAIADQINAMQITDYGATATGSVVKIFGPASAAGSTPVIDKTGTMTLTATSFTGATTTAQLNGITPADPVQYSCQQNFTILSTDGYWNGSTTYNLSNGTVGQQDGWMAKPMWDGGISSYTITTPYTTTQRRQSTTSGATVTKVWSKTTTTVGAACTIPGTPAGAASAPMLDTTDGSHYVGLGSSGTSTSSPDGTRCFNIGTNSASVHAWFCRGSSGNNPVSGYRNATVTDGAGVTWYVVSSGANATGCISDNSKFGSGYSTTQGICPASASTSGNQVTVTNYTQNESISGATSTSIDEYVATQTTSQTVTNGVFGTVGPLTPSTLSYVFSRNIGTSSTSATSDTCAGQNGLITPCPNLSGAWTAGTTTGPTCTATASLPAAGSTTPIVTSTTSSGGSTSTVVTSTVGPTAGTPTQSAVTASGGTSDTLADVAMYYYQTDLRDESLGNCTGALGLDVCDNNVFIRQSDNNTQQHMTTFTLGLGARGKMIYSPSYLTDTSGDYWAVKNGLTASSTVCTWQTAGTTCTWPIPGSGKPENIDDLWHAAVNGRGAFFSATDPTTLSAGLSNALGGINSRQGAAAAAATSTLNPVAGNNFAYVASYTTISWKGNLEARGINTITGTVTENALWCIENVPAGNCSTPGTVVSETSGSTTAYYCVTPDSVICLDGELVGTDCKVPVATACTGTMGTLVSSTVDSRNIYTSNGSASSPAFVSFDATYAASHSSYFSAMASSLSQWSSLTSAQQTNAASDTNMVNFLRGKPNYEDRSSNAVDSRVYRFREAVLGDALESQPAFMAGPVFSYPYPGYSNFKTTQASRAGTVYMGTNDGMMHAFAADTGTERWAYVPSMIIPNMWKLADKNYGATPTTPHINLVNGSAITSDVCTANCSNVATAVWKTILVAGLNGGGRGYYALDITNPSSPALLWEITTTSGIGTVKDDDLGYSFGQPIITTLNDGTWAVLVTSGYNNISPGTGQGYLYVLNAATGAIISKISTGVGNTTTPSGLAKIAGWNNESAGNKVGYVYGGDLLGNVWRFDINGTDTATIGTGNVMKFASLYSDTASSNPQPVTTTPVLATIDGERIVIVGTGKYLELSDLATTQKQSIYAIKDPDATATLANPRTTLVQQKVKINPNASGTRVSDSSNYVDFTSGRGWYLDFPDTGERVNIDSQLVEGVLLVPTTVPSNTDCSPGGYGWLNYLDYKTGLSVNPPTGLVATKFDAPIVGINVIYVQGNPKVLVVTATDPTPTEDPNVQFKGSAPQFVGKRVTWRELVQ